MTKIEWTEQTWNPIVGCSIVSPGCTNCYAMRMAARLETMLPQLEHYRGLTKRVNGKPVWTGKVALAAEKTLLEPLKTRRPTMWFVNSMSDLFHEDVPDDWIDRVFAVMALCPQHTFQCLTKRSKRMREYTNYPGVARRIYELACDLTLDYDLPVVLIAPGIDARFAPAGTKVFLDEWPLPNVWLGVSCERQQEADERIPDLLATPAAVRFVSAEPLLSPLDLSQWLGDKDGCGRNRLHGGDEGRAGDRHAWPDMAHGGASGREAWDQNHPMRETPGGAPDDVGLPPGACDDGRPARECLGTSGGVATFSRTDPVRPDDQSSQREQGGQPPGEFGGRNLLRASAPLTTCAGGRGSTGGAESGGEADPRPSGGDTSQTGHEGAAQSHRSELRGQRQDGIEDRARPALAWVVVGGESGPDARPMHPDWARSIRDQCLAAGVPFFFKQWGEWGPVPRREDLPGRPQMVRAGDLFISLSGETYSLGADLSCPIEDRATPMRRLGKARAGRLLDGREWNEMPAVRPAAAEVACHG